MLTSTTTRTFSGHGNYNSDRGRNADRTIFPGMTKRQHSHTLPTSGKNSTGSSSVVTANYSGFQLVGNDVTTSVSLTNTTTSGKYYNAEGKLVSNISEASTFVATTNTTTMTVDVGVGSVSNNVNVTQSSSTTTYNVEGQSGMKDFGGLQLTDGKTTKSSSSSTMSLSAAPESLQTAAKAEAKNNEKAIPNNASEHIDSSVQRTLEQEYNYNEHEINKVNKHH